MVTKNNMNTPKTRKQEQTIEHTNEMNNNNKKTIHFSSIASNMHCHYLF